MRSTAEGVWSKLVTEPINAVADWLNDYKYDIVIAGATVATGGPGGLTLAGLRELAAVAAERTMGRALIYDIGGGVKAAEQAFNALATNYSAAVTTATSGARVATFAESGVAHTATLYRSTSGATAGTSTIEIRKAGAKAMEKFRF